MSKRSLSSFDRRNGAKDLKMVIPKDLKMVFTASLFGARHFGDAVENKPASSLVVSLDKTLNEMPPPLCGRQVAQAPRKRQLPSKCGRPVQNIGIQFTFS